MATDFVVCDQLRPRPACASVQTGHYLNYLLSRKNNSLTCYMQNFNIMAVSEAEQAGLSLILSHCAPYVSGFCIVYTVFAFTP